MITGKRIMGVHPNTTGFGFVILDEKGEILDYGINSIRPINNEKCIEKINEIIRYNHPQILIIEDCESSKKSPRVKRLVKQLSYTINPDVKIVQYTREQVKSVFGIFGAKNKYEISQKIAEAYPEFKGKLPHKRKPWQPENYYQGLFDAMALILTHQYLND